MLKSFVEIKFEICSIYKAQCAEENSPLNKNFQYWYGNTQADFFTVYIALGKLD